MELRLVKKISIQEKIINRYCDLQWLKVITYSHFLLKISADFQFGVSLQGLMQTYATTHSLERER